MAGCVTASFLALAREPASRTCWAAQGLIEALVDQHGARTLGNIGNTADWNVCKTGLINELRDHPESCFVLHELSAESAERLRDRLARLDAVVVLDPSAFPPGFLAALPGLNRATATAQALVGADPEMVRVQDLPHAGLPPLAVYVRDRGARERSRVAAYQERLKSFTWCFPSGPEGGKPVAITVTGRSPKPYGDLMLPLLDARENATNHASGGRSAAEYQTQGARDAGSVGQPAHP